MTAALELDKLTKCFGSITAVNQLSLEIPEGSLVGLIGPNGAGKTTLFGLLCGYLHPTSGSIKIRGEQMLPNTPRVTRVAALPQDADLPPRMKVIDALVMLGRLAGLPGAVAKARGQAALEELGLGELALRKVGLLSHGQRRRVGIAQTLLGEKEIILLDEPTAGLDALASAELRQLIAKLRRNRTIVLASHNLAEVEKLCDRAAIIDHGQLVSTGTMDDMKSAQALVTIKLGAALLEDHPVLVALQQLAGVQSVAINKEALDLVLLDEGESATGALTNQVLQVLMEKDVLIQGVERGKSLEQRFIEDTSRP